MHAGQRHPFGVIADEEGDRSDACRYHAASARARVLQHCRMRRQTSPADCACERKLIEKSRVVVDQASRKYLAFPCAGRDFKPLELTKNLQQAAFIAQL